MKQQQEASAQVPQKQEQTGMSMGKGIAVILSFTLAFALIGFGIGKVFFWDQYSTDAKVDIDLKQNLKKVQSNPDNPVDHMALGISYTKKAEHDRAIGEFKKVLSLDPKNGGATYYMGLSYLALAQYDKAITALKENIEGSGANSFASHLNLAIAYYNTQKYDDALKELEISNRLNPGIPLSKYWRGMVYEKQNKPQEALAEYQEALNFNPNDEATKTAFDRVTKALAK